MPGLYTHTNRATGTILTSTIYNTDHQNHIDNQTPQMTDDYSANVAQMQAVTNPGGVGSESLATSLSGELERLRYALQQLHSGAQWYAVAPKAGSLVELYDQAGPGATNLDFTTASWFDGTYAQLWITITNFTVSANGHAMQAQVSNDGGSSWINSAGAYGRFIIGAQGTGAAASSTIDTATVMQLLSDITTNASENNTIILKLLVPPNASTYHSFEFLGHYLRHNGGANVFNISTGMFVHRNGASVVSGIRISNGSGGTWNAGNVRVLGVKA